MELTLRLMFDSIEKAPRNRPGERCVGVMLLLERNLVSDTLLLGIAARTLDLTIGTLWTQENSPDFEHLS